MAPCTWVFKRDLNSDSKDLNLRFLMQGLGLLKPTLPAVKHLLMLEPQQGHFLVLCCLCSNCFLSSSRSRETI